MEKSFSVSQQVGERREKERIWWFIKSALQVMETSPLLCFAHPARMNNPKMCFCSFLSPHGFLIQSKEVLCFQIPSLLSSLSALLLFTNDTRRPKYPVCAPPRFTSRKLLSAKKGVGRMSGEHDLNNCVGGSHQRNQNAVTTRQPSGRLFPDSCVTSGL